MSLPNEIISGLLSSAKDEDTYQVSRSLRFNRPDIPYLLRNPSSSGNRTTWTFSCWLKRSLLDSSTNVYPIFGSFDGSSTLDYLSFYQDTLYFYFASSILVQTTQIFRDPSAWYHIVCVVDTTQAQTSSTASDSRLRFYVNGTQITSFSTISMPAQNTQSSRWNVSGVDNIIGGYRAGLGAQYFSGYMTEINFIDGQALTPSSFGQSDANGRWVPKAYTGTYGTNGFYLKFADNSGTTATTLGKDSSPNGNNWTPNNFSVTAGVGNDSLVDSPTNYGTDTGLGGEVRGNYGTLNLLKKASGDTLSDGALRFTGGTSGAVGFSTATIAYPSSGKWYWEIIRLAATASAEVGIVVDSRDNSGNFTPGYFADGYGYYASAGTIYNNNSATAYGNSWTAANDIIGIAFDADNGRLFFAKNGVWQNSGDPVAGTNAAFTGLTGNIYYPYVAHDAYSNPDIYANFGQRPFAYTAPTGFKTLNTQNLPTPAIKNPSKYMNIATYTGTGATRSITGVGFQPDLVWTKSRSNAETHKLVDSVRGATKALSSETTGDEVTESGLTSFDSDGFTIDGTTDTGYNTNTYTYVGWAWKKGVTPGFDIVNYTGTGVARTISHSLGAVPHFMIVKARTTASTDQGWPVYHRNLTSASYYILLNSNLAEVLASTAWNGTTPSSSVFSVGTSNLTNTNNDTYVAYLWTEIDGFSRFGTYTGNGAADGPFVWCGFRPRYITIKDSNNSNLGFRIYDTTRETFNVMSGSPEAYLNSAQVAFSATRALDITSNGFKIRTSASGLNASGTKYIFAAFAELPFKYSRGR